MIKANISSKINRHHHYHENKSGGQPERIVERSGCTCEPAAIEQQQPQLGASTDTNNIAYITRRNTTRRNTRIEQRSLAASSFGAGLINCIQRISPSERHIMKGRESSGKMPFIKQLACARNSPRTSSTSRSISHKKTSSSFALFAIMLTLVALFILAALAGGVHSLNCYTCSSADNPACDESFSGRANITDTDCEKQIGRPAKVCRKIVQYIEHKKVVIRSCGWIDDRAESDKQQQLQQQGPERKSMCYKRSGTFALMMESCVCYEDNCNHSASLVPNQNVLLLLTGSCSLVYLYVVKQFELIGQQS